LSKSSYGNCEVSKKSRTHGQVPAEILPHSGYVETAEAVLLQNSNISEDEMPVIQGKPIEEVFAREPQFYPLASSVTNVAEPDRTKYLRIALRLVGVTFIVGIYTLIIVWPSGWSWHTGHSHDLAHYLQMILGVYPTLGVFLRSLASVAR
jgi:hypothetical protein